MIHLLKHFIPSQIKRNIYSYLRDKLHQEFIADQRALREELESRIPKYDLATKHIENLRVIANRNELLKLVVTNGVAAEIGVNKGEYSKKILEIAKPQKLHLIDLWGDETYHEGLMELVKNIFSKEMQKGIVEINRGLSTEVLSSFKDNYFDWVYLDTDHSYSTTAKELQVLSAKIKDGGLILGHDFVMGNWIIGYRFGVIEAVHEFCLKENWEMVYLTAELSISRSFALRKIR